MTAEPTSQDLAEKMLEKYGPLLSGSALYTALGFRTYPAFHRARKHGELGVPVFTIPGRRGVFALTENVANWIKMHADMGKNSESTKSSGVK